MSLSTYTTRAKHSPFIRWVLCSVYSLERIFLNTVMSYTRHITNTRDAMVLLRYDTEKPRTFRNVNSATVLMEIIKINPKIPRTIRVMSGCSFVELFISGTDHLCQSLSRKFGFFQSFITYRVSQSDEHADAIHQLILRCFEDFSLRPSVEQCARHALGCSQGQGEVAPMSNL